MSPNLLTTALLLQTYAGVPNEEAKALAAFVLQWKDALGIRLEGRPFPKSTLHLSHSHLVLHDQIRAVFEKNLTLGQEMGCLKSH